MFYKIEYLAKYSTLKCISYYKTNSENLKYYLYKQVTDASELFSGFLKQCGVKANVTVGLLFGHAPVIVPLILSILNSGNSFYFISEKENLLLMVKDCKRNGIQYILAGKNLELELINHLVIKKNIINIFATDIQLLQINEIDDNSLESNVNICYCAATSGSTGQAKFVKVPFQCIMPNIEELISKFGLNSNDTIALISPTTFDPFVVDVFMGLTVGANLVFLDNSLRLSHSILASCLFSNLECGTTFIQCTPSYFKLFGIEQIRTILSDTSSLKTLVLGGEKFPLQMEMNSWNNRKDIYNIYGITEVSCWATIEKWDVNREISLGDPIDDTTLLDVKSGELYIGSASRICILDNEPGGTIFTSEPIWRATGDLVEHKNGRYYFKGRRDDSIKRFGIKLNLTVIEEMILQLLPKILELKMIFYKQKELVLFYKCQDSDLITPEEIQQIINTHLKPYEIPSEIIKLDKLPLSRNGKLSSQKLAECYFENYITNRSTITASDLFLSEITKVNSSIMEIKRRKTDKTDWSFLALGGNSFIALNIVMTIEARLGITTPKLLPFLLDESKTINDCLIYLNQLESSIEPTKTIKYTETITATILSKFDLKKCIDSTPSINQLNNKVVISIGSHSGIILNIELSNNKIISKLQLPDRIESEIGMFDHYGIVGCYNGHLYCYNVLNGEIEWSFNSRGMIKCKALIVSNLILFGNYNSEFNFYCLGIKGELKYRKMIGTKSIISNPVIYFNTFCIICTLDGTCEVFDYLDGQTKWCVNLSTPIFSTPAVIDQRYILIAEVGGIVHCLNQDGHKVWDFKTNSNIFSSFEIETLTETCFLIYFGSYNKKMYCLEYDANNPLNITLKLESEELKSSIYSTPKLFNLAKKYILVVATVGIIYIFDRENFTISHQLTLPGEIFSTPAVIPITNSAINSSCNIAIGSRDNYFYLINFKNKN